MCLYKRGTLKVYIERETMAENMFETAAGSVTGKDHVLAGRNNQDSFYVSQNQGVAIAIVADGCSDNYKAGHISRNETGSQLGVRILEKSIRMNLHLIDNSPLTFWYMVKSRVLEKMSEVILSMGGEIKEIVCNHFLFTCVGAIVSEKKTWIFSIGDGVYFVNGEMKNLGPFPGNAPPYIAYSM